MRIVCEECKKAYDYERDDFCPRCGAYNPPPKNWTVDSQGTVVRADGLNEANHTGSFVHREVHREKAVRRLVQLDRPRPASDSPASHAAKRRQAAQGSMKTILTLLCWIFFVLILLRFFSL